MARQLLLERPRLLLGNTFAQALGAEMRGCWKQFNSAHTVEADPDALEQGSVESPLVCRFCLLVQLSASTEKSEHRLQTLLELVEDDRLSAQRMLCGSRLALDALLLFSQQLQAHATGVVSLEQLALLVLELLESLALDLDLAAALGSGPLDVGRDLSSDTFNLGRFDVDGGVCERHLGFDERDGCVRQLTGGALLLPADAEEVAVELLVGPA